MEIKKNTTEEVKQITDESLVLQGCGDELTEWVDGINEMLTETKILKDGAEFSDVSSFEHDGLTNLIFNMSDVKLDLGRLAMWRLQTHEQFGGTWLSDYLPNRLGVQMGEAKQEVAKSDKPDCELIGKDSNIFNLMGIASRTLRRAGMSEQATEMCDKINKSLSYDEALCIIGDYVNITGAEEQTQDFSMKGYE